MIVTHIDCKVTNYFPNGQIIWQFFCHTALERCVAKNPEKGGCKLRER